MERVSRYELNKEYNPENEWIAAVDILSSLDMLHYENLPYKEYVYCNGCAPRSFKSFIRLYCPLVKGIDVGVY